MQLKVIGSGSTGNSYLMYNESECLIIELGFTFKTIKQALNFNLRSVVGALVSHEHLDHSAGVKDALKAGIKCYMSPGTAEAMQLQHHNLNLVNHRQQFKIGNFEVMAFDLNHDCAQPLGFLIRHPESGLTCFITDSYYTEYYFPGLNHVIIEANYCQEILQANFEAGRLHGMVKNRVEKSHMSIDTCIQFLGANKLDNVNNILLIHLSDGNSNAEDFKQRAIRATGKNVQLAEKNLVLNWTLNPF